MRFALAFALAVLFGGVPRTQAATFFLAVDPDLNNGGSVDFQQFNPILGTLTGIQVTLSSKLDGGAVIQVQGSGIGATSFSGTLSVRDPGTIPMFQQAVQSNAPCISTGSGCTESRRVIPDTFSGGPLFFAPPDGAGSYLWLTAPFVGPGLVSLSLTSDFVVPPLTCQQGLGGPFSCVEQNKIFWNGDLNVEYFYLPAAGGGGASIASDNVAAAVASVVPEPATLGMLAMGLAGLASSRRRREQTCGACNPAIIQLDAVHAR